MDTATDRFNYGVYKVLDKIKGYIISKGREISYQFSLDITRQKPISYQEEENALKFLLENKVMKQIQYDVDASVGEPGTHKFRAYKIYHFKINNKFSEYHKNFKLKTNNKNLDQKFIKMQLVDCIKIEKIKGKQKDLLVALSNMKLIPRSDLEIKTKSKDLSGLIRDTNNRIKGSPFEIVLLRAKSETGGSHYRLEFVSE